MTAFTKFTIILFILTVISLLVEGLTGWNLTSVEKLGVLIIVATNSILNTIESNK